MSVGRLLLALSALSFFAAPAAHAAVATPDPAAVAAAVRLLDAVDYEANVDQIIEELSVQVRRQFTDHVNEGLDEPLPDDLMKRLQGIVDTHFRKIMNENRADMKRATAIAYASRFTTQELERLAILESDPLLKRMRVESPKLMVAAMSFGEKLADQDRPELESEIKRAVQDYYKDRPDAPAVSLEPNMLPKQG